MAGHPAAGYSDVAGALGLGTMPIRLLLEHDHSFDPDEVVLLVGAFESTLADLGLTNREDRVTMIVAQKIVQLAKDGERDPDRLRDEAIKSLSE
jgi:hypothetical protein